MKWCDGSCKQKKDILVGIGMSFFVFFLVWIFLTWKQALRHPLTPLSSSHRSFEQSQASSVRVVFPPIETHRFVDPRAPTLTWRVWPLRLKKDCGVLKGAVVNHHILANDLLGQLFSRLAFCAPTIKHVIILSPDHFVRGSTPVSTHTRSYIAAGQEILSDKALIQLATSTNAFVHEDPELFEREHGIGALIPFVTHAWPEAKVASFAIRSDLSPLQAEFFVAFLKQVMTTDTILIVSSDMSHYLSKEQAFRHDEETRQAFRTNDRSFFWKATDDNTDNGKSVWLALTALGGVSWHEQAHRISSDYDGSDTNTTSYITGWWSLR